LKVSGLPSPRRLRRSAAKRPNSISRVFSGCSDSANSPNLTESYFVNQLLLRIKQLPRLTSAED
jgi:hypothetical protein